jgi:hypothetical protein
MTFESARHTDGAQALELDGGATRGFAAIT